MIYLDYAADTPVAPEVLEAYCKATQTYIANPNAHHVLGQAAKARITEATKSIATYFEVAPEEVIFTSGATESNNLAIKGIATSGRRYGKHMITSYLEHSSVTGPMSALAQEGYEIDYVDLLPNGQIDLDHLKELLREDTILVSVCAVDSELGTVQPVQEIAAILSEYEHCKFHVDATQAVAKMPVSMKGIDLMTFTPHKFYGLHGCGVLLKKQGLRIDPLIHGGVSTTIFRSGTPTAALIIATEEALKLYTAHQNEQYEYVTKLNQMVREALSKNPKVMINSPADAVPFIINISVKEKKALAVQEALAEREIYISTKSACSTLNTPSRSVMAITKDRKRAMSTLRISLSHLTTKEEVGTFITAFNEIMNA